MRTEPPPAKQSRGSRGREGVVAFGPRGRIPRDRRAQQAVSFPPRGTRGDGAESSWVVFVRSTPLLFPAPSLSACLASSEQGQLELLDLYELTGHIKAKEPESSKKQVRSAAKCLVCLFPERQGRCCCCLCPPGCVYERGRRDLRTTSLKRSMRFVQTGTDAPRNHSLV